MLLLSLVFSVLCLESECVLQPNECLHHHLVQPWQPLWLASTFVGMLMTGLRLLLPTPLLAITRCCGAWVPKMPGQGGHQRENGVSVWL